MLKWLTARRARPRVPDPTTIERAAPTTIGAPDPQGARYAARATELHTAANALGYLSFEHAVKAGRMAEVLKWRPSPRVGESDPVRSPRDSSVR